MFYNCTIEDIETLYDFIKCNKLTDIEDVLFHVVQDNDVVNFGWLAILENDKLVELFSCLIDKMNHEYNQNIIKSYYEDIKNSMV